MVSVTAGWVQGSAQRQPIVATLSGNVNSVKVYSGTLPGDAISLQRQLRNADRL